MATETRTPSQLTLDRTPARMLTFILAVGRFASIRGKLQTRGYTDAEHAHGWSLLHAIDPSIGRPALASTQSDAAVREAFAQIDAWDNENLPIADAALSHRAPEAHAFLFANDLAPAEGAESVRVVTTFLDRVDALEAHAKGDDAKPSKKAARGDETPTAPPLTKAQARAAVEVLTARGIHEAERKRAREWLSVLSKGVSPQDDGPSAASAAERQAALEALYRWLNEWSTIARKVITRRDHLIALGIATKKTSKKTSAKKDDAAKGDATKKDDTNKG